MENINSASTVSDGAALAIEVPAHDFSADAGAVQQPAERWIGVSRGHRVGKPAFGDGELKDLHLIFDPDPHVPDAFG